MGECQWHARGYGRVSATLAAMVALLWLCETAPALDTCSSLTRRERATSASGTHRFEVAVAVTLPVAGLLQRALAALGEHDSALRARLMGRLATALAFTGAEHNAPLIVRQALEMARRVADKTTLADVLASTLWVVDRRPDILHQSLATAAELAQVADEVGNGILRALAHGWLLDLLLEL